MSEGFAGYHPAKVLSCHNYPQVTPLQHIFFFYYTCNEILILKVGTMKTEKKFDEKLLAIVDFVREKKFYIVDPSDIQSLLHHHSSEFLSTPPPIIFQSVLVYDPEIFQSQLDSLRKSLKSKSMSDSLNN